MEVSPLPLPIEGKQLEIVWIVLINGSPNRVFKEEEEAYRYMVKEQTLSPLWHYAMSAFYLY